MVGWSGVVWCGVGFRGLGNWQILEKRLYPPLSDFVVLPSSPRPKMKGSG